MRVPLALLAVVFLAGCPSTPPPATGQPTSESQPSASPGQTANPTDFHGTWSTIDDKGDPFDVVIFPNGQAVTTWTKGPQGARGERGYWRIDGPSVMAFYEDGWTDIIQPRTGGFQHKGFAPGTPLSGKPGNTAAATREQGPVVEFVGVWRLNKEPDGNYLYIALLANGRAASTINGGTEGTWELKDNSAVCRWPDGWVDVIERGAGGYVKHSWVGSSPSESASADLAPAVRVGETKFQIAP